MIIRSILILLFLVEIDVQADGHGDVTLQFFNSSHDFELGGGVEHVASTSEEELEVFGDITASEIDSLYSIIDREAFEYGTAMAHTISAIEYYTGGLTTSVETQDSLLLEEDFGRAKFLEKDVCSFYSVAVWIQWWLSQKDRMLLWRYLKLIKNMSPKLLHVVPVLNNSMLNRVIEFKNSLVFILITKYRE